MSNCQQRRAVATANRKGKKKTHGPNQQKRSTQRKKSARSTWSRLFINTGSRAGTKLKPLPCYAVGHPQQLWPHTASCSPLFPSLRRHDSKRAPHTHTHRDTHSQTHGHTEGNFEIGPHLRHVAGATHYLTGCKGSNIPTSSLTWLAYHLPIVSCIIASIWLHCRSSSIRASDTLEPRMKMAKPNQEMNSSTVQETRINLLTIYQIWRINVLTRVS